MTTGERSASRTAVLVCQGRAAAHGSGAPRFEDPVAEVLLREPERAVVEQVRAGTPPTGWAQRSAYEAVRACAGVIVPRTVAIDDAIRRHPADQLVVLGAGLDSRSWRLAELAGTDVWEVDHPASQRDKRARVDGVQPVARRVRFVAVDFGRDLLDEALEGGGHTRDRPTVWLWEGVVPYLSRPEVADTLRVVARRSAAGSALIVNYQAPSVRALGGRMVARLMEAVAGSRVSAGEPWRSLWTPARMRSLLIANGFEVERDDDLLTIAEHLGLPRRARTSLRTGRVAVAVR